MGDLVPLTRWVLRSPKDAVVILAPPQAQREGRPSQVLIYPGDVHELCENSERCTSDEGSCFCLTRFTKGLYLVS